MKLTLSNGTQIDPVTLTGGQQPDKSVMGLQKTIKTLEGGDYTNRSGDSGSSAGAYQWNNDNKPLKPGELPSHWKNAAAQYLKDQNAPMTQENQDFVAYQQIKAYKDQGRTPEEIDALWNGASKDEKTGLYVHNSKNRADQFRKLALGGNSSSTTTSGHKPFQVSAPTGDTTAATEKPQVQQDDLLNNPITRGITKFGDFMTGGGASQLGNEIGSAIAIGREKKKGLLGGQDNSQYITPVNPKEAAIGAGKTALGIASTIGAGKLAQGGVNLVRGLLGKDILSSPAVEQGIKSVGLNMNKFTAMNNVDKVESLTEALKDASPIHQEVIQQAIDKLRPIAIKEAGGIVKKVVPGLVNQAKGGLINNAGKLALGALGWQGATKLKDKIFTGK